MAEKIFVFTLALLLTFILRWGFRTLPKESWQILASLPKEKKENGEWEGVNLTYYGLFTANASLLALAMMFVLLCSLLIPIIEVITIAVVILSICIPTSKIIARVVEKKPHTSTIGGASFAGILIAPWVVYLTNATLGRWIGFNLPVLVGFAVIAIAYAFGEGVGRLACLSFGCCYGKPLSRTNQLLQTIFNNRSMVFTGKTKKIAYADGLDGEKMIPVQAVTSIISIIAGLSGTYLFLKNYHLSALILTIVTTQLWRIISEFFRADYRGDYRVSLYQIMAVGAIFYSVFIACLFPVAATQPTDIVAGLRSLWNPIVIISLECFWGVVFFFTGRSKVTQAFITFHVIKERI